MKRKCASQKQSKERVQSQLVNKGELEDVANIKIILDRVDRSPDFRGSSSSFLVFDCLLYLQLCTACFVPCLIFLSVMWMRATYASRFVVPFGTVPQQHAIGHVPRSHPHSHDDAMQFRLRYVLRPAFLLRTIHTEGRCAYEAAYNSAFSSSFVVSLMTTQHITVFVLRLPRCFLHSSVLSPSSCYSFH